MSHRVKWDCYYSSPTIQTGLKGRTCKLNDKDADSDNDKVCGRFKSTTNGNTNGLKLHLKNYHQEIYLKKLGEK